MLLPEADFEAADAKISQMSPVCIKKLNCPFLIKYSLPPTC